MRIRSVRRQRPDSFKRLAAYIIDERDLGIGDPRDWNERPGEKVAWAYARNCVSEGLGPSVREIMVNQARNKTAKNDKTYHMVISFPDGEKPSREVLEHIEAELCAAIGYAQHQRIVAAHRNTDNLHLHIAISKVHPETNRCYTPFCDFFKLDNTATELEKKHGLTRERRHQSYERELGGEQWIGRESGETERLWAQFKEERKGYAADHRLAVSLFRKKWRDYGIKMEDWHKSRYDNLRRQHLSRANRISSTRKIDAYKIQERVERKLKEKEARAELQAQLSTLTWEDFLAREATRGSDAAAIALDRLREDRGQDLGRG